MGNISEETVSKAKLDRIDGYKRYATIREEKGFRSDAQIAALSGVSKPTFTRWHQGISEPKLSNLEKIAKAMKVSVKRLAGL